jgi:hypothetical protein
MLDLITPVNDVFRRDFEVADTDLLNPTESDSLVQGEWLALDSDGKLERVGASSVPRAWQMFTQKGDFAAQALGKTCVLQAHEYEAETDIFDSALTYAIGDELTVKAITVDSVTRSGLTNDVTAGTDYVYAIVTKLPDNNDSKLRYQTVSPYKFASS